MTGACSASFARVICAPKSRFCGKSFQLMSKSILTNSCTIFKPASPDHVTSALLLFRKRGSLSYFRCCRYRCIVRHHYYLILCNGWRRRLYGWCALRAPLRPGHAAGPNFGLAGCRVRGRASRALAGTRLCFDYFSIVCVAWCVKRIQICLFKLSC